MAVFHILLLFIPYETGWDFENLQYLDFWAVEGFLRNTFYNGWNPIFPWFAYFAVGLYLGRQDWTQNKPNVKCFNRTCVIHFIEMIRFASPYLNLSPKVMEFIHSDYIPPFYLL